MAPTGHPGPARARATAGRFAPPLALMAVIFALSAQPDLTTGLGTFDLVARKLAHAFEFGLLWWLWLRALGYRAPWAAAAITIAYAVGDEYHQTFVPGREGTAVDVAIDCAGVAVAWALDHRLRRRRPSQPAAVGGEQDGLGAIDRT
jgi:VanZ family protein